MKPKVSYSEVFGSFERICAMRGNTKLVANGVVYHLNHKDKENGLVELRVKDKIIHVKRGDPLLRELRKL